MDTRHMSAKQKVHPGFKKAAMRISENMGGDMPPAKKRERAGAILASAARKASPMAKRMNPRLMKVMK